MRYVRCLFGFHEWKCYTHEHYGIGMECQTRHRVCQVCARRQMQIDGVLGPMWIDEFWNSPGWRDG